VVIVASAGGLAALKQVLGSLPHSLHAAVLVLLHLSPDHPSMMADLLAGSTRRSVKQAQGGEFAAAGTVFVAPPDHHLELGADGALRLTQAPLVHFSRPSADVLLESVAQPGRLVIAVVLTGAGRDGASGVAAVKAAGGRVIIQDPASAAFPGMPTAAIATGAADWVLPLEAIGARIVALVEGAAHGG
jgi:two-component system chemotaxis response regulator CheB